MNPSDWYFITAHFGRGGGDLGFLIERSDPDPSTGMPLYYGLAERGSATSDAKWTIKKYVYDGNGHWLYSLVSDPNQIWDNRASVTSYK